MRPPEFQQFHVTVGARMFDVDAFVASDGRRLVVKLDHVDEVWADDTGADVTRSLSKTMRRKLVAAVRRESREDGR